ncbi:hypothetical protein [Micromonospora parva]|uniref:hypothetical protein n=1 Tax=Micromonospora parva TaxID=1464048 RepID=UPI00340D592C
MQDLRFDEIEGLLDGGGDRQARSVGQGRGIRAEEGRRGCRWHHHLGAFVWGVEAAGGERGGQETAGSGVGARADEPEACGRPGLGQRVRQGRHRRARHRDLVAVGVVFAVEGGRVRAGIPVMGSGDEWRSCRWPVVAAVAVRGAARRSRRRICVNTVGIGVVSRPKAEVYRQLGLRLNYQPETQTVRAEVDLNAHRGVMGCVRGATRPIAPPPMTLSATLKLTQI